MRLNVEIWKYRGMQEIMDEARLDLRVQELVGISNLEIVNRCVSSC